MKQALVDVVIIGGGPAGLYASFYGGLRDLKVTVLEAQENLGGKLNFYPQKFVWDVGGMAGTKGEEICQNLIQQGMLFGATIYTNSPAIGLTKSENLFYVEDQQGRIHPCRTVLLAIGGGIISPKKLTIPISKIVSKNLHYTFPKHKAIQKKRVFVSGGGDAAIDYANECLELAKEVTLVYRGEKIKAHEASLASFIAGGGKVRLNTVIVDVQEGTKSELEVSLNCQGKTEKLAADHLLIQHGYDYNSAFLDGVPFEFLKEQDYYLKCLEPTQTNIPGIFAAGDSQSYAGKLYLLAGAFQDGANSINQIKQYLEPKSYGQAMVSSHNDKFNEMNHELLWTE
ncbi:NAD(P)/FAD-dependent oxidoreductase [Carnobacterium gallinarum]|uniref:NAD(P)/FAD-dependent oxidoreductase n=1 Tax=Carnobacterium gallinarum TaxID=2749 RepID=UPI000557D0C1|nr:NAD(P)/FAD-dependent oxidoreductase [Carnobacterium gallinarum]